MAPRSHDTITPPQVDHTTGIRLLMTQLEAGQRLLRSRPLTEDDHARWGIITKRHLEKAFGRGTPTILTVVDAGVRSVCPVGADRKWWEAYRAERLWSQLTELVGALKLLGAEAKFAVPKPDGPPEIPKAPAEAVPSKPASEPMPPPAPPEFTTWGTDSHVPPAPVDAAVAPVVDPFSGWANHVPEKASHVPEAASRVAEPKFEPQPATVAPTAGLEFFTGVACLNGHSVTGAAEAYPGRATPKCKGCGAATLRICRECGVALRGGQYSMRLENRAEPAWSVPNYCHSCGAAFPWTRLKCEAIEATIAELQEVDETEREGLLALVPDTISQTPKTAVAVMRWQRALSKLPAQTRSLVVDVLKQAAAPLVAQHLGLVS